MKDLRIYGGYLALNVWQLDIQTIENNFRVQKQIE